MNEFSFGSSFEFCPAAFSGRAVFVAGREGRPAGASGGMALWCCRWLVQSVAEKNGAVIWPANSKARWPSAKTSPQKRALENPLKLPHRTEARGKNQLQRLDGLQERIGLGTVRGFLVSAQPATNRVQFLTQTLQEVINRFPRKRQAEILRRRFHAGIGQQLEQQLAPQCGGDRMARQHVGQENREASSAAATLSAIRAEDPLAPSQESAIVSGGIVAVKKAVPV